MVNVVRTFSPNSGRRGREPSSRRPAFRGPSALPSVL